MRRTLSISGIALGAALLAPLSGARAQVGLDIETLPLAPLSGSIDTGTLYIQPAIPAAAGTTRTMIFRTDAFGQRSEIGAVTAYRALSNRRLSGGDEIGNNVLFWSQVDPSLPRERISVVGPERDALLRVLAFGCSEAGGTPRHCSRIGLKHDIEYIEEFGLAEQVVLPRRRVAPARIETTPVEAYVSPPPPPAPYVAPPPASYIETAPLPAPAPLVVERPATSSAPAAVESVQADDGDRTVSASRLFVGREGFEPKDFAAYGILAFKSRATSDDRDRYINICEAFFAALESSTQLQVPTLKQMVTVWPVNDPADETLADTLNASRSSAESCETAVDNYDLYTATRAIFHAGQAEVELKGRGPHLLAWSPAGKKGAIDAVVLVADLGDVSTPSDAKRVLELWRDDIEGDSTLWEDGYSFEKLRLKLQLIANRYGEGLLEVFGG